MITRRHSKIKRCDYSITNSLRSSRISLGGRRFHAGRANGLLLPTRPTWNPYITNTVARSSWLSGRQYLALPLCKNKTAKILPPKNMNFCATKNVLTESLCDVAKADRVERRLHMRRWASPRLQMIGEDVKRMLLSPWSLKEVCIFIAKALVFFSNTVILSVDVQVVYNPRSRKRWRM